MSLSISSLTPARKAVLLALLVCLLPLTYLIFNREWIYMPPLWADAYINQGYAFFYKFTNYKEYYKSSRVPWLMILFYVQKLFGPYLLTPVVVVGGWILAGLSYFFLLSRFANRSVALFILPWIVFFPALVGTYAGGGTYQNPASLIYMNLSLIFWLGSSSSQTRMNTFLSGFFLACTLFTNIVYVNLLLIYPMLDNSMGRSFDRKKYFWLFAGAVSGTFFWCVLNYAHGRSFVFFSTLFRALGKYLGNSDNQLSWWKPLSFKMFFGLSFGPYLSFHVCLFIISVTRLLILFRRKHLRDLIVTLNYAALFVLWVFWQAIGQTSLVPADFIHPLQLPAFLMIADWLRQSRGDIPPPWKTWGLIIFVLWCALLYSVPIKVKFGIYSGYIVPLGYGLILISLGLLFLIRSPKWATALSAMALAFTYSVFSHEPRHPFATCHYRSEAHDAVISIVVELQKMEPNPGNVFYYGSDEIFAPRITTCGRLGPAPIYKIMETSRDIMGHNLSYKIPAPKIDELRKSDYKDLLKRSGLLVLFPFQSLEHKKQFLQKTKDLGIELLHMKTSTVIVSGIKIKYEIYRVK